jgi:hypothetical protein
MSYNFEYELSSIVFGGIWELLERDIKEKDKTHIDKLEELVKYYSDTYVMSAKHLKDKLEELKNL